MRTHRLFVRHGLVALVAAVLLIAGHGAALYFLSAHAALSASVVAGVVVLAALKHLGAFGALYALWRRRHSR